MPRFTSSYDSASLFYRDFIPDPQFNGVDIAPPSTSKITSEHKNVTLVFLHGWPMSSLMYEHLLVPLCQDHKFRCIAPDRRGFGKSEWNGRGCNDAAKSIITYETFADDVAFLLKDLAVGDFVFIGASMGCGESLLAWERSAYVQEHCKV
jgi:non-heme chloroperoxidase